MEKRFVFTDARLRALPLPEPGKRATYYDEKQPGLQLRVSSTGIKTFSVLRRAHGGRLERFTIGRYPDVPLDATEAERKPLTARARAAHIVSQLRAAENPSEVRRQLRASITLGELFEKYLADRQRAGRRSTKAMRETWERYLGEMPPAGRKKHGRKRTKAPEGVDWSRRRHSDVTTTSIGDLHARIAHAKPTTANRVHELLRATYGYGVRVKLIKENPAEGITAAKENSRTRFIAGHEFPRFSKALAAEPEHWRDLFTVLLFVGYRKGATCAMSWDDLDVDAGTWAIPGERAKNGDPLVVPVKGPALDALRRRFAARTSPKWVFPGRSKRGHLTQPKKAWARLCKRAGLSNLRIHDMRHTLGSWLAMTGVSLLAIGRALGHKDPRSSQTYAHLQAEAVAGAVTTAHDAMQAAITDPKVIPLPVVPARKAA